MAKELTANFSAKTDKFSEGISKLKSNLTELNKSLDENKKAISETNKEIKQLEKEQKQLAKEIENGGGATKEQADRMQQLETAIGQAKVKAAELKTEQAELKVDLKKTTKALEEQKSQAAESGKSLDTVKTSAKSLATTLTATAAGFSAVVGALYAMTASAGAAADDINTLSKQYGLSTEEIQKFKYATDLIDVSLETYTASIARNVRSMTAYQNGTEATVAAYDALGVAVTNADGSLRDSHSVYNDVINALGKIEDETQRDSIAMTLLGRSAQQLNPLILGGADALDELGQKAQKLGLILPQENLDNLNAFNDKIDTLKANMNGLQMVVADSFANSFDSFFDAGDEFLEFIQKLKSDGTLDEMAKDLSDLLANLVNFLKTAITVGWQFKDAIAAGVVALVTFKTAINIGNIISGTVTAVKSFTTATKAATTAQQVFNATGVANPYVLIGSAIAAVIGGVIAYGVAASDSADSVKNLADQTTILADNAESAAKEAQSLSEVVSKYKTIYSSVDDTAKRKEELAALQEDLNTLYGEEADQIDLVNGSYDEQLKLLQGINEEERIRKLNQVTADLQEAERSAASVSSTTTSVRVEYTEETAESINDAFSKIMQDVNAGLGELDALRLSTHDFIKAGENGALDFSLNGTLEEQIDTLTKMKQAIIDTGEANGDLSESYNAVFDKLTELETLRNNVDRLKTAYDLLTGAQSENCEEIESDVLPAYDDVTDAIEENRKASEENKKSTSSLISEYKSLAAAMEEYSANGQLSLDTALNLIDNGYAACVAIDSETGAVRLNVEAYKELTNAKIETQRATLELEKQSLELEQQTLEQQQGLLLLAHNQEAVQEELRAVSDRLGEIPDRLSQINSQMNVLDALSADTVNWGSDDYTSPFTKPSENGSDKKSDSDYYSEAYNAYKTEADKKLDLINRELTAKRKLRDETIAAIDDEIEARKRLNEDNDLEEEINAIQAQLKYSQLDEFSRGQLENKLSDLYDQKSEIEWQRQKQDEKDAANAAYAAEEERLKASQDSINESLKTFKQIMDSLAQGVTNVSNIVNNNVTKNNTANINLASQALSMSQITKAVKDALMDNIVIK